MNDVNYCNGWTVMAEKPKFTPRRDLERKIEARNSANASGTKRLSFSFPPETARYLEELAEGQGITQNEVLRKALATEHYLYNEIKRGAKVFLQNSDEQMREVVFR